MKKKIPKTMILVLLRYEVFHIFYCTVFTLLAIYHSLSSELLERELLTILLTTQYYCCSSFLSIERYGSAKPSVVSLSDTSFPFCDNAPSSAGVFQQQHHTHYSYALLGQQQQRTTRPGANCTTLTTGFSTDGHQFSFL